MESLGALPPKSRGPTSFPALSCNVALISSLRTSARHSVAEHSQTVFPQSGEEPPASYRQTQGWTPLHFGPSSADVHSASLPRSVVVWSAVCGTQRYVRWEPTVHGDELCKAHQPLHRSSGENQNMKEPSDTTPSKSWYVTLGSTDRLASP